jgi:putative ABC transport system substrate-binding protein
MRFARGPAVLLTLGLALFAASPVAEPQTPAMSYRVGWLHPGPVPPEWIDGFRRGLREFGYVEGQDLVVESRWGDGKFDALPAMATDLVRLKVDALIAGNTAAVFALRDATQTIPIVMTGTNDPVGIGLVASLARPAGNITGLSGVGPQLSGKRLELLKEIVPGLKRVTALSNPDNPSMVLALQATQSAADALGLTLQSLHVRTPGELDRAFAAVLRARSQALVLPAESMLHGQRARIAQFAMTHGLASAGAWREFAEAGGLMVYGASISDIFRRSVGYLDKLRKGATPAELPIEEPTRFDVIVNLKTARALSLTIPPAVLARADEVIQ